MILVPLPRTALDRLWPVIAPFAEQMAVRFPDDWPVAETRRRAETGILLLWAIWSPEERTVTAIVGTEIHDKPSGRRALVIALAAGRDHAKCIPVLSELERYGAAHGCDYVEIRGRAGWARALKTYRAKPGVILEKELN